MSIVEMPSAICRLSTRETTATAEMVNPMLVMAEPSVRLMLFAAD